MSDLFSNLALGFHVVFQFVPWSPAWLDDRFHETGIQKSPGSLELEGYWWIPRLRMAERGVTSWEHGGKPLRWR